MTCIQDQGVLIVSLLVPFHSAPSPEIEQVCDCQPEASGSPGEERHEGPLGLSGQRRLMVQHLPFLQTKVKRGQSRRWRQGKNI